jgi:ubiquinone biosynthesis protein UbiJ
MQATLSAHPVVADAADARQLARTRVIALARLMDSAVELPGLRTRVGLDAVLGLAPVVGDVISAAIGLYIVHQARELGASRWLQARMVANLLADAALGAVPLAGDLADVYFRANVRNLKLMQKVLGEPYIDVEPLR